MFETRPRNTTPRRGQVTARNQHGRSSRHTQPACEQELASSSSCRPASQSDLQRLPYEGPRSWYAKGLRYGLAPPSGEIVTQIQLGGASTDSLVRILHAQPGSRSPRALLKVASAPVVIDGTDGGGEQGMREMITADPLPGDCARHQCGCATDTSYFHRRSAS